MNHVFAYTPMALHFAEVQRPNFTPGGLVSIVFQNIPVIPWVWRSLKPLNALHSVWGSKPLLTR